MEVCSNIQTKAQFENTFKSISAAFENCMSSFNEFIDSQSVTFKYWLNYMELVEILLEFLYSERAKN